jgi:hypothetical protein
MSPPLAAVVQKLLKCQLIGGLVITSTSRILAIINVLSV